MTATERENLALVASDEIMRAAAVYCRDHNLQPDVDAMVVVMRRLTLERLPAAIKEARSLLVGTDDRTPCEDRFLELVEAIGRDAAREATGT